MLRQGFMRCGCTSTLDQPNSLPGGALDASRNQEGILQLSDCLKDVLPNDLSRDGFQHGMSNRSSSVAAVQNRVRSESWTPIAAASRIGDVVVWDSDVDRT